MDHGNTESEEVAINRDSLLAAWRTEIKRIRNSTVTHIMKLKNRAVEVMQQKKCGTVISEE